MSANLTITRWATKSVGVLKLRGVLLLQDVPGAMAEISNALRRAPNGVLVVDVGGLAAPYSNAILTVFPAVLRRSGGWPQAALHLAGAGPELAGRLDAVRMQRYLPVHRTLSDGLIHAELDVATERLQLPLPPDPACLVTARAAVRDLWPEAAIARREEAVLVVNELATNAIQHVGLPFTLTLAGTPWRLLAAVTDPSGQEPIVRPPRGTATNGRGMQLVAGLSDDWGVRRIHPTGKTVWAAMAASAKPVPWSGSRRLR